MKVLDCNAMFWVPRTMYSTLNYYEGNLYIPTTEMIGVKCYFDPMIL